VAGVTGPLPEIPTSCDDIGLEPTIPDPCATIMATKSTGADGKPIDETLDTETIQAAIDACPAGQAVKLTANGANNAFVSGPLFLRSGTTIWIDGGTTLFSSRNPRDFDYSPGLCGGNGTGNSSCKGLINASKVDNTGVVGAGTIDGRGGDLVMGETATWWQLEKTYSGSLAAPRLVMTDGGTNFTLYQVTLRNSAKFHVVIQGTAGYRVWGITINTPPSAPNTDGVDPSGATNGVIAYSKITTGDDNVAIKGAGPVDGLIIAHNHFGRGHGMSIGSETFGGVKNVRVCDLSLDGTDNGLRIKSDTSRGGLVQTISYVDVCMRNVKKPLVFDPFYSATTGQLIPNFRDILVRNVHVLGGGALTMRGRDAAHALGLWLDNVVFDKVPTGTYSDATFLTGPGPVGVTPTGTNVATSALPAQAAQPRDCDNAWTTF
jgi:polygalacturonase